jgi:maltooligosyltrehalose trehalohydrolase
MRFEVWAPRAQRVEIEVDGAGEAMRQDPAREGRGWWIADVEGAGGGSRYAFVLDGGEPRPDPRSPSQPEGPHEPSEVVDHSAFRWSDAGFRAAPLAAAVIYELHIGTFSDEGTFEGAIERLEHLVELGVTHLELMPVCEFPGRRGWGYDGVNLWAPHHAMGGPEGLKGLVDAAHGRGLAVILDVVYNHLGPSGNYLREFGPYFTDAYRTPWGDAVNFDQAGSDEVRRFFVDNALMWLRDYHFDGLRLDAVHAMFDRSAVHFLEQLASEVRRLSANLGRSLDVIAESGLNDPRLVRAVEAGGHGLSAQWSDDYHHALHVTLTGEHEGYYADFSGAEDLAAAINRVFVQDGRPSRFRGRSHGRPAGDLPRSRFVHYAQNHDQVGNRARGERLGALLGGAGREGSTAGLKLAAALTILGPAVPMLFAGEEWGASTPFCYFTDHDDPELAEAVRRGRRAEIAAFGWNPDDIPDPQAEETFLASRLDWSERRRPPHTELLDWHKKLIALRRGERDLCDADPGGTRAEIDAESGVLVLRRGRFTVALNITRSEAAIAAPEVAAVVCSSHPVERAGGRVAIPAWATIVWRNNE